jgi:hypothetical protein
MRSVFVGPEYAGKSTLIDLLTDYYRQRSQRVHGDDHFTIPDATLSPESRAAYVGYPNDVKERLQRMQLQYHVEVLRNYDHVMIAGWHIEEAIYSEMYGEDPENPYYPRYHYRHQRLYEVQVMEARLPDLVLIHVTASDGKIRERMTADPHEYQITKSADVPALKARFTDEVDKSLFTHKGLLIEIDTTDSTPQQSLDELLLKSEPLITQGELALRQLPVPDGPYDVVYENGVRRMVPKSR